MKPHRANSRRLEQAFQDLEDGSISAEDHWWLMSELRENPAARRAYRQHMSFATLLHWSAEAWAPEHAEKEIARPSFTRRRPRRLMLAAALVALLAIAASIFIYQSRSLPPAQVVAGSETQWRYASGGIGHDGDFLPGTRLQVARGSLEITTPRRTRIFIEGPASLEISDPQRLSLTSGKAWFETGAGEKGLTVTTERLSASAPATRFGIAVSSGSDRIQVESGELFLESKLPGIPDTKLGPGQAAIADLVGRPTLTPVDPGLFLDELPREPAFIHWSFDGDDAGSFHPDARGMDPAPVRITGIPQQTQPVKPKLIKGAFGAALDLTDGNAFAESDFPGISGGGPRTVAVWVKGWPIKRRYNANSVYYTPSVVMWGDESIDGGSWTLRAHCITGIIGTQWGSNGFLTAGQLGSRRILDGEWHHIACVFTGEVTATGEVKVHHYIDGERVPTTVATMGVGVDTRAGGKPSTRLRIACDSMMPSGPGNVPVAIDELFIVRSALSDSQIKTLYQENRFTTEE